MTHLTPEQEQRIRNYVIKHLATNKGHGFRTLDIKRMFPELSHEAELEAWQIAVSLYIEYQNRLSVEKINDIRHQRAQAVHDLNRDYTKICRDIERRNVEKKLDGDRI